jgi:hypothetical protein
MMIDDEWSVDRDRGFTWWAADFAQHIWADEPQRVEEFTLSRIHARTDLVTGFDATDENLKAVGLLARYATLSGPLIDPGNPQRLQLASSLVVHEETEGLATQLMAWAATIQVAEGHIIAPAYAEACHSTVAASPHPSSGQRTQGDDLLNIIAALVAPHGEHPSMWADGEIEQVGDLFQGPPCVLANADRTGLTAEFPFSSRTSLLQVMTNEGNPRLGNGCLMLLTLPWGGNDVDTARMALELNAAEQGAPESGYFLGSWCHYDRGLTFVSFLPNVLHKPGMVQNLVMSSVNRVRWVTEVQFGFDMEEHYDQACEQKAAQLASLAKLMKEGR